MPTAFISLNTRVAAVGLLKPAAPDHCTLHTFHAQSTTAIWWPAPLATDTAQKSASEERELRNFTK